MHEWEAGTCPFTGTTAEEIALKHLFETPPSLARFMKKITFGAENVIRRCLEKDPANRFPDYLSLDLALEQAARKRGVEYLRFNPELRYKMPMVGSGNFREHARATGLWNDAKTHAILEYSDIEPFVKEAQALSAVGDHTRAAEIYGSLFVPEMATAVPEYRFIQDIVIGYGYSPIHLGRARKQSKL